MSRGDVIRMAREVGIPTGRVGGYDKELERFAELVAGAEREACAKLCDDETEDVPLTAMADAIRARVRGMQP